jgi:transposase
MLSLPSSIRIFVHAFPTDMRRGFNGLCALVSRAFGKNVLEGDYFVFVNRMRNRCKILYWDRAPEVSGTDPRRIRPGTPC